MPTTCTPTLSCGVVVSVAGFVAEPAISRRRAPRAERFAMIRRMCDNGRHPGVPRSGSCTPIFRD